MNRLERIQKLSRAIISYRGLYNPDTKKWKVAPDKAKRANIVKWLLTLGRSHDQINQDAKIIDAFQNKDQFDAWIAEISKPKTNLPE